jgi:hypothetical protein
MEAVSTQEPVLYESKECAPIRPSNIEYYNISDTYPEILQLPSTFSWETTLEQHVECNVDACHLYLRHFINQMCRQETKEHDVDSMQCQGAIIQSANLQTITIGATIWYAKKDAGGNTVEGGHQAIYTYNL